MTGRRLVAVLALALLIAFAGCGKKEETPAGREDAPGMFIVTVPPKTRKKDGKREITVTIMQTRETPEDEIILLGSFEAATDEEFTETVELIPDEEQSKYTDETRLRYVYRYTALIPLSAEALWVRTPECEVERKDGSRKTIPGKVFYNFVADRYTAIS